MGELVAFENMTLDGVMQSPGRPDEDTRGGFTATAWAVPYPDQVMMEQSGAQMGTSAALLLGRRTYLDFYGHWPKQTDGNPFTDVLNKARKYVVSSTMTSPLPWENSTLLSSVDEVASVKERLDGDLVVLGSGVLLESLGTLVDRYVVSIFPLALGQGRRLPFPASRFELVSSVPTTTGVIIATYLRTTS
jgi:dihydrofolate reductase